MNSDKSLLERVALAAQNCVQQHPAVVLGSGASVVHGIRGMGDLANYLLENVAADEGAEIDAWLLIRTALASDDGLEEALLKTTAPLSLVNKIIELTWKAIAADDIALMARAIRGEEKFHLSDLIQGMFKSTHMSVNIVTPNYDRVAEYACDISGHMHATGFLPGLIRSREGNEAISIRQGSHAARTVKIWKVHGSIDWFVGKDGRVISLPISADLPETLEPLIVTPGVSKYERTHDEPFRSAIQGADAALGAASSFLCVGYGFRDRHIQPKIVERCRQRNVPIVILARTLTDEAKVFLSANAGQAYLALEKDGDGTRVYTPDHPGGCTMPHSEMWSLENFNKMTL
jgi:SIR2-like domain